MTSTIEPPIKPTWERRIDNAFHWSLKHWLGFVNAGLLVYAGLPWLSPLAKASGNEFIGQLLFLAYRPLCHQIAERSFFVCGHQVGFCHRCTALYTGLLVGGLLFSKIRHKVEPLSLRIGLLLTLPILLDGGSHVINDALGLAFRGDNSFGTFNFWLRMVTALVFAAAAILVVYPRLDRDLRYALPTAAK